MLYKVENGKLLVKNVCENNDFEINIGVGKTVESLAVDKNNKYVAWIEKHEKKDILFINKLGEEEIISIYSGEIGDVKWSFNCDKIFFNNGNTICSVDINTKMIEKIFKFTTIKTWPARLTLSPNGEKIAISKYKGDSRKIITYDFERKEIMNHSFSCYQYTWINNNEILYHCFSGFKLLNVNTSKSTVFLKDVISLKKIKNFSNEFKEISEIIDNKSQSFFSDINNPQFSNDRIYFSIQVINDEKVIRSILSLDIEKKELKMHYIIKTKESSIYDFKILTEENMIYLHLSHEKDNKFYSEKIYIKDGKRMNYDSFMPINRYYLPTELN